MAFIDPSKAYAYFEDNYHLKKSTKGWWLFKCPICNELEDRKKIAVHFHYGVVKCWICGTKLSIVDFVAETEGIDYTEARRKLKEYKPSNFKLEALEEIVSGGVEYIDVDLPYGYKPILEGDGALGVRARKYLSDRGFDLKELDRMGIGYCSEQNPNKDEDDFFGYIIIPFKREGKLVYYIGRDFIGNFLRYKNPATEKFNVGKAELIFNEDALFLYDEVFVLEGWADAVTIGREAISTQGWSWSNIQKDKILKSDADIITIVPDAGADERGISFYKKALQIALEICQYKKVKVINMNKIAELGKDVNAMGREAFMKHYREYDYMSYSDIMMEILS